TRAPEATRFVIPDGGQRNQADGRDLGGLATCDEASDKTYFSPVLRTLRYRAANWPSASESGPIREFTLGEYNDAPLECSTMNVSASLPSAETIFTVMRTVLALPATTA